MKRLYNTARAWLKKIKVGLPKVCPACRSKELAKDTKANEIYCSKCGLIVW